MAQATQVQPVRRVADYTPGGAVGAGDVVLQGTLFGISEQDIAASALGSISVDGVFDIVKVAGAVRAGAPIYWDSTGDPVGGTGGSGACTTVAGALKLMGWAIQSALSADTTARVKLVNVASTAIVGSLTTPIVDPDTAGAIPVTGEGHVPLVTAEAETRSLPDPTIAGQQLLLYFKVDVGNCVITAVSAINQTGNTIMTFTDIGEVIQLIAIEDDAASFEWRVVHNDGVGLS